MKVRLDTLLAERGLFVSRSRAAASVMAGEVFVGRERRRAAKAGELVGEDVEVDVAAGQAFVSRGGQKLDNALRATGLHVAGRRAIDVGASTGGFTDCLLQRGAAEVVAVDVARGELAWALRSDPRVHVLERTNARALRPDQLPWRPDLLVADVSFISVAKVLPAVVGCVAPRWDGLVMVKPQFEVGRERVGSGGVVRSADDRRTALIAVGRAAAGLGCSVLGFVSSGLPGPKGNEESFVRLAEGGREDEVADLEAAAREVEP